MTFVNKSYLSLRAATLPKPTFLGGYRLNTSLGSRWHIGCIHCPRQDMTTLWGQDMAKKKINSKTTKKTRSLKKDPGKTTGTVAIKKGATAAKKNDSENAKTSPKGDEAIDDPVRMYLMQMGRIPLLTRDEEVSSAMDIEETKAVFRNTMLATDFMLRGALEALQLVRDGKLRLDRTIEVSVTNKPEKQRIMLRIVPNIATLRKLLDQNAIDYHYAIDIKNPTKERHAVWRQLIIRRNRCVRLVEEMNLRYSRLQPMFEQLQEINERMQALYSLLQELSLIHI